MLEQSEKKENLQKNLLEKIGENYNRVLKSLLKERLQLMGEIIPDNISDESVPYLLEEITVKAEKQRLLSDGPKNEFILLQGASGSGKDTIGEQLEKSGIKKIPRDTDRERRPNEVDGKDYYFISSERFSEKMQKGEYIGSPAETYGERRGINKKRINESLNKERFYLGGSARTSLDFFNDEKYSQYKFLSVFLLTPNFEELINRLQKRTAEEISKNSNLQVNSEKQLLIRIQASVDHLEKARKNVDGRPVTDIFVINDQIERAAEKIESLI